MKYRRRDNLILAENEWTKTYILCDSFDSEAKINYIMKLTLR